jgi:catechol 2,3-dioxygenase-like lactoylglutathione lyase family enzyme
MRRKARLRIHHIAMRTADLERLERFYVDVLGFAVVRRRQGARPESVWLDAGEAVLMLELAGDGEPAVMPGTMELVAFGVDEEDKEAWRTRIEGGGGRIEAETAHTIYFRDPDGRRIGASTYPLR